MNIAFDWVAQFAGRLLPLVANHLWQATLFALFVWFVAAHLLKRAPAQVRYFVWLIVAAKFALPSALLALLLNRAGLGVASLLQDSRDVNSFTFFTEATQPVLHPFQSAAAIVSPASTAYAFLSCALITIWLVGTIALLLCWWVKRRKFLRDVRGSETITDVRAWEKLCAAQSRLKVKTKIRLIVSSRVNEPGVWGVWRSLILLPAGLAERLTDVELEALMLHELLHVKRRDNLVSHAQMLLRCVWWFHPLVWFVEGRLLAERERACDEAVLISLSGAREAYASSVLKVLRFCVHSPVAGTSGMADSDLQRRLGYIMDFKQDGRWRFWQACALGAAGTALVLITFVAGAFDAKSVLAQTTAPGGRGGAGQGSASAQSGGSASGGGQRQERRAARATSGSNFDARLDAQVDADANESVDPTVVFAPSGAQNAECTETEVMQLPDRAVRFENKEGSPLTITNASMKAATREQLRGIYHGDLSGENYSVLPIVTLVNNSGERITSVALRFAVGGSKGGAILEQIVMIEPQDTYTFKTAWRRLNAMLRAAPEEVMVTLESAQFDDGKRWGRQLPAHPPIPPPPPSPPAPPSEPRPPASPANAQSGSLRLLHKVEPAYPAAARQSGVEGDVAVEFTVNDQGEVTSARAIEGHPLLRAAAVEAMQQFRFSPPSDGARTRHRAIFSFSSYESGAVAQSSR